MVMGRHDQAADRIGIVLLLAGGALTLLLNFLPAPQQQTAQETAIPRTVDTQQATEAQVACEIYKASGGTSSFKLIKAVRTPSGDLCLQYQLDAKAGAFIAIGTSTAASGQHQIQDAATCDGLRGKEITRLIRDRIKSC